MNARTAHAHAWEPATVPCGTCVPHPAVRCADPGCPLHERPIDIMRWGDPRKVEADISRLTAELRAASADNKAAYDHWRKCDQRATSLIHALTGLREHYEAVTADHD